MRASASTKLHVLQLPAALVLLLTVHEACSISASSNSCSDFFNPSVAVHTPPGGERGVFAMTRVEAGEVLVTVPRIRALSVQCVALKREGGDTPQSGATD